LIYSDSVEFKGAKLRISSDSQVLVEEGFSEFIRLRRELEEFSSGFPLFEESLFPVLLPSKAPRLAKQMASSSRLAGVGPLAAVAGTIAEGIARRLVSLGAENVIADNGGDLFIFSAEPVRLGLFAGSRSDCFSLNLLPENLPLAVCSSSSKIGHSFSFGECSLATVFSKDASIADAFATAVCNRIKQESDARPALEWACSFNRVEGVLAFIENKIFSAGRTPPLARASASEIMQKVTVSDYSDWNIFFNNNEYLTLC